MMLVGRNVAKKRGWSQVMGAIGGLVVGGLVSICGLAVLLISGPIIGNVIRPINNSVYYPPSSYGTQPTPVFRTYPTNSPNPCYTWAQITLAMVGKRICVMGTAAQVYPVYGNVSTRINFTSVPNTFFLISTYYAFYYWQNGTRHDLAVGDCVQATEVIKVFDDGSHQIPYMQISDLYRCAP
jgi:hypothetical protein